MEAGDWGVQGFNPGPKTEFGRLYVIHLMTLVYVIGQGAAGPLSRRYACTLAYHLNIPP